MEVPVAGHSGRSGRDDVVWGGLVDVWGPLVDVWGGLVDVTTGVHSTSDAKLHSSSIGSNNKFSGQTW